MSIGKIPPQSDGGPPDPNGGRFHLTRPIHPKDIAMQMAQMCMSIPEGLKIVVYFKDNVLWFSGPLGLPFMPMEPQPWMIGELQSVQRLSIFTGVHTLFENTYEVNDNKNQIRSRSVYAEMLFKHYRRFPLTSSLVDGPEAQERIANSFLFWSFTKEMINRITTAQVIDRPVGFTIAVKNDHKTLEDNFKYFSERFFD